MKTKTTTINGNIYKIALVLMCSLTAALTLKAQDIYISSWDGNSVGEYTLSGSPVNAALISGLNEPQGMAIFGNNLFVENSDQTDPSGGSIGEYTLGGTPVNTAFISGLNDPDNMAFSANNLFVASFNGGVSEYTTSGTPVNTSERASAALAPPSSNGPLRLSLIYWIAVRNYL